MGPASRSTCDFGLIPTVSVGLDSKRQDCLPARLCELLGIRASLNILGLVSKYAVHAIN